MDTPLTRDNARNDRALEEMWFDGEFVISGQARAQFSDPAGFIAGPIDLHVSDRGEIRGILRIEERSATEDLPFGLTQFLWRNRPVAEQEGGSLTISVDSERNECTRLTVRNESGELVALPPISHHESFSVYGLQIQLHNAVWTVADSLPAQYWVLPLTNFVTNWRHYSGTFNVHPLRFWRPTTIPDDLTEDQRSVIEMNDRSRNKLIAFEYQGLPCYIEPLPDFAERKQRLVDRQDHRLVTAVMVGELPDGIETPEQAEVFLPRDLLHLLSLATGSEVGASWIELRDTKGGLVQRIHTYRGRPTYARGHRAIDEIHHTGTGHFLTQALSSPAFNTAALRVTTRNLVRAGYVGEATLEDRLSYVFRALNGLCESQGLHGRVEAKHCLSQPDTGDVYRVTNKAARELRRIAAKARHDGRHEAAGIIEKVADNIPGARVVERGFGRQVVALLQRYGLADADILEMHLAANPWSGKRSWPDLITRYRGLVMHSGYVDFDDDPATIQDVYVLLKHLHDLVLRILLKMVEYDGRYQPTVSDWLTEAGVDWVTNDTPARRLGYT